MDEDEKTPRRRVAKAGERWIQVRVSIEDHALLKEWADRNATSVSYLIRRLVERALRPGERKKGDLP